MFGQRLVQYGMQHEGPVEAQLYISSPLEGLSTKSRQYMYVNSRYVANDAASKLLNTLFQQVDLCAHQQCLLNSQGSFTVEE